MINAWREPLVFELPPVGDLRGGRWCRWLDTSLPSPADIVPLNEAPEVGDGTYELQSHSVAVVFARVLDARDG